MKIIIRNLIVFCAIVAAVGCSEDKLHDSIIDIPKESTNPIDIWIKENLTLPHNIEVIYKWVDGETNVAKNLVPPAEEKVIPFLDVAKKVWIDVYVNVAGENYFKMLSPKQLLLIGSAAYNDNRTKTQGTAEAGRKIVLYEINAFNSKDKDGLKRFFHVIHHEFAHIMHQTIMYDETEYAKITPGGYKTDWQNGDDNDAMNEGFISKYARLNTHEDFVEVIATLLTNSKEEFDAIIDGVEKEEGRLALRQKEKFVAAYFQKAWKINIYEFQAAAIEAIDHVVNE